MQSQLVKNNKKVKTFIIYCIFIILTILLAIFFLPENTILITSRYFEHSTSTTTPIENLPNSSTYFHPNMESNKQDTSDDIRQRGNNYSVGQINDTVEDNIYSCDKSYDAYLRSIQEMNFITIKFFQDIPYTDHINYIKSQNFSQELQELIVRLDDYNTNYLVNPAIDSEDEQLVFPKNNAFIRKFIKIKKVSNIPNDKEELKSIITKDLNVNIQYLYNYKLPQNSFSSRLAE